MDRSHRREAQIDRLRSSGPWVFLWLLILVALIGVIVIVTGHDSKCVQGGDGARGVCLPPPGSYHK